MRFPLLSKELVAFNSCAGGIHCLLGTLPLGGHPYPVDGPTTIYMWTQGYIDATKTRKKRVKLRDWWGWNTRRRWREVTLDMIKITYTNMNFE